MPLAFIGFGLMILASNIVMTLFGTDPTTVGVGMGETELAQLTALIVAPMVRLVGVLCLFIGGLTYMFGFGPLFSAGATESRSTLPEQEERARQKRTLSYSQVGKSASDRVDHALGRLRAMPADAFSPEARLDYESIRDRHLPSLRTAHATARAAFPAEGADALSIDTELASSLDLIAGKLDELIVGCGDEARSGFDVERRFVELRHPSIADPMTLPGSHMVEREA